MSKAAYRATALKHPMMGLFGSKSKNRFSDQKTENSVKQHKKLSLLIKFGTCCEREHIMEK